MHSSPALQLAGCLAVVCLTSKNWFSFGYWSPVVVCSAAGFFCARRNAKKGGRSPQGAKPSRRTNKSRGGRRMTRNRGKAARNKGRRLRRGEERAVPGQRRARRKRDERGGECEQKRKGEEKRATWRKHQLGKSRTNTERHCQRAPKGLTGKEAEAQGGADGPEGGVQAAQRREEVRRLTAEA